MVNRERVGRLVICSTGLAAVAALMVLIYDAAHEDHPPAPPRPHVTQQVAPAADPVSVAREHPGFSVAVIPAATDVVPVAPATGSAAATLGCSGEDDAAVPPAAARLGPVPAAPRAWRPRRLPRP